jgi:hypothetical protein
VSNLTIKYVLVIENDGWMKEEAFATSEAMLARVKELETPAVSAEPATPEATPATPEPPAV